VGPLPRNSPPQFPDVEVLLMNWLNPFSQQEGPQLPGAEVLTGVRFCTDLPYIPAGASGCWVRVGRVSGATQSLFTDRPVVDVDVYSFDRETAWAAARAIQNLIFWQLRGSATPDGCVQDVKDVIGPRWIPDLNQDMSRIGASYQLHTKPVVLPSGS
jgi:hypothetical protein